MPRHQYRGDCPICGSHEIDLVHTRYGYSYECRQCHATVGCHKGTARPLGILADKETKELRMECHELFDSKWRNPRERRALYKQLADLMGISPEDCHFGKMNKKQLWIALSIIKEF